MTIEANPTSPCGLCTFHEIETGGGYTPFPESRWESRCLLYRLFKANTTGHWQGLSGGDYLNESVEKGTAGAMVNLSLGQPFIATTTGVITAPIQAQLRHQVDKRLPEDYDEYGKFELLGAAINEVRGDNNDYLGESEEEATTETKQAQFEDAKYNNQIQYEIESDTGNQSMDPERIKDNLQQLRTMQSEEWVDLGQDQREECIKTLQEKGLMSYVLVGTMASVDPEQVDRPDPVEYAKDGATSGGVSGTTTTARKAETTAVGSGTIDLSSSVSSGVRQGSLKGVVTAITKVGSDAFSTEEKIKGTGDRLEEVLLKAVKGIHPHSEQEQTYDSRDSYDELVVELIKLLEQEELLEAYND